MMICFINEKTAYEMRISDWSSDVCSSDLDAAEVEAQGREPAGDEGLVQRVDDLVVHRAAMLRMRVQHERDRGVAFLRMQVAAFDASLGTVDDDLGHRILMTDRGAVAGHSASRADLSIPMKNRLPRDQVK